MRRQDPNLPSARALTINAKGFRTRTTLMPDADSLPNCLLTPTEDSQPGCSLRVDLTANGPTRPMRCRYNRGYLQNLPGRIEKGLWRTFLDSSQPKYGLTLFAVLV